MASPTPGVFPNGQVLVSSAATPNQIEIILQQIVAQIYGYNILTGPPPVGNSETFNSPQPWTYLVRVGWQQDGQPAWKITEDICVLRAVTLDEEYSKTREGILVQDGPDNLTQQMGYTQVWRVYFSVYGPNCYDRARLIVSAMSLDWVHDILATNNLYTVDDWRRPVRTPENFQGQWWPRADVMLDFNESVIESIIIPAAASVEVTVESSTASVTVDIES